MATNFLRPARRASGIGLITAVTLLFAAPAQAAELTIGEDSIVRAYVHPPKWVDGCPGCPGLLFKWEVITEPDKIVEEEPASIRIQKAMEALQRYAEAVPPIDWPNNPLVHKAMAALSDAVNLAGNGTFVVADDPEGSERFADAERLIGDGLSALGQVALQADPADAAALRARATESIHEAVLQLATQG